MHKNTLWKNLYYKKKDLISSNQVIVLSGETGFFLLLIYYSPEKFTEQRFEGMKNCDFFFVSLCVCVLFVRFFFSSIQKYQFIKNIKGCGKSTQIPQFILDDWIERGCGSLCNIICTQVSYVCVFSLLIFLFCFVMLVKKICSVYFYYHQWGQYDITWVLYGTL